MRSSRLPSSVSGDVFAAANMSNTLAWRPMFARSINRLQDGESGGLRSLYLAKPADAN